MFFIPLDSYRKIEEPNADAKNLFPCRKIQFYGKSLHKNISSRTQNHTKNEMKNKPTKKIAGTSNPPMA